MLNPLVPLAAMLALLTTSAAPPPETGPDGSGTEEMIQHFVIHVPNVTVSRATIITRTTRTRVPAPPPPPRSYVEKKADNCLRMDRIVGFAVSRPDSVDLMLNDGTLRRASLGKNCPALGFYSGFYIRPNPDGKMCGGRDAIRSRAGRSCGIAGFKTLVPGK